MLKHYDADIGEVISCFNSLYRSHNLHLPPEDHSVCLDYIIAAALGINNAGYLTAESLLLQAGFPALAVDGLISYLNHILGDTLYNIIIHAKTNINDVITFTIVDDIAYIKITTRPVDALTAYTHQLKDSLEDGDWIPERVRQHYGVL